MQLKEILKNEEGTWKFEAEITEQQHAFLINFALNVLLARGAIDPEHLQKVEEPKGTQGVLVQ